MAYIGNNYSSQLSAPATDVFSGNGSTTTFSLTRPVLTNYSVEVVVNNVPQNPNSAFSINASNQIVFTEAPSAGVNNIYVKYNYVIGYQGSLGQGTVETNDLGSITTINSIGENLTLETNGIPGITIDQGQTVIVTGPLYATNGTQLRFGVNGSTKVFIDSSGNLLPNSNNVQNLGSTATAWANIYTNDLHLNNETNVNGNDIDGTTGNWTIQEGQENLYIINNNTGKKYAFMLQEIK